MATKQQKRKKSGNAHSVYAIMLIITSLLIILSLVGLFGSYGKIFNTFFFGMFGQSVYAISCSMLLCGIFLVMDRKITMDKKVTVYLLLLFVTTILILNCATTVDFITKNDPGKYLKDVYANGETTAGGIVSGLLLSLPMSYFGYTATLIIFIVLLVLIAIITYRCLDKRGGKGKKTAVVREFKPIENSSSEGGNQSSDMYIHKNGGEKKSQGRREKRFNSSYINEGENEETQELLSDSELLKGFEKHDNKTGEKRPIPAGVYFNSERSDTIPVVDDFSKDFSGGDYSDIGFSAYNNSGSTAPTRDVPPISGDKDGGGFSSFGRSGKTSDVDGKSSPTNGSFTKPKIVITNNDLFDDNAPPVADRTSPRRVAKPAEPFGGATTTDIYRKSVAPGNVKTPVYNNSARNSDYNVPPVSLLKTYPINREASKAQIEKKRAVLEKVLLNNNYRAKVVGVVEGPSVLRFELRVDDTEDIKRIHGLQPRMSYDLSCNVNILAPIPNRDLIGVEIVSPNKRIIGIREMIDTPEFLTSRKLIFALGKSVENKNYYSDIADMPHCIVAGSTGSGKSVCLNALLCSLLYKFSPKELKIILVDPKFVEFNAYYNLPHMLLKEPICQIDKAINALNWAIGEMEERYKKFADIRVKKLSEYNEKNPDDYMPYIIIMIDEFGDIIMSKKKGVEELVVRLAQKARAAGIHLIIATQTPKKEIITGNIKSNCPTRIAFRVTDDVYSRVIIGENGAEGLMGNGDMLYRSSKGDLERLQGPYISNEEIELVTDYIREHNTSFEIDETVEDIIYQKQVIIQGFDDVGGESMELIKKAIEIFLENPASVSTNVLQRRMGMGHPKASSIVDILESKGIISPLENNRRKLLITREDAAEMFGKDEF